MKAADLLIADLRYFGEAFWHNEDVGEKRLTFFVSLATAIATGLILLWAQPSDGRAAINVEGVRGVSVAAVGALLVLCLLSYFRMLKRSSVAEQYKDTMDYVRSRYVVLFPNLSEYIVPVRPKESRLARYVSGGYAETFAAFNGLLLTGLLMLVHQGEAAIVLALLAGAGFSVLLWIPIVRGRK